jgi:hypothetical protein
MANKLSSISMEIRTQGNLTDAMMELSKIEPSKDKPFKFSLAEGGSDRSSKQNRLSFMWYKIRGGLTGHGTEYERNLCKLMYGCPILAFDDQEFERFYHETLKPLPYQNQLDAMEFLPVTSLMTTKQFAAYLDEVDRQSASMGMVLPRPEDLYYAALMKEAEERNL